MVDADVTARAAHYSTAMTVQRRAVILCAVWVFASGATARAQHSTAPELVVTDADAQSLMRSIVTPSGSARRFGFEPQPLPDRDSLVPHPEWFVAYQILALDAPPAASINAGFYAVNRVTGDTWELVLCRRVSTPLIARFRRRLRQRSTLTAAEWRRAAVTRPCEPM